MIKAEDCTVLVGSGAEPYLFQRELEDAIAQLHQVENLAQIHGLELPNMNKLQNSL
ncbi:hypothetical protein AB3R30_02830 [Leptolyngbyaceae cyanobacterium UHCC 1019]